MSKRRRIRWLVCCFAVVLGGRPGWAMLAFAGTDPTDGEWPSWVEEGEAWRERAAAVNEGDLVFLSRSPDTAVHHHANRILISDRSLQDGWVAMEQCHTHLDQVAAAQILFNPDRSRGLELVSFRNIESAYVQDNTIQLRGVGDLSEVCIRGESQALAISDGRTFELQNGPYMRRFLDGYYPLRVSLEIHHPPSLLLADSLPEAQPGFSIDEDQGTVRVDALFEGRLRTRFRFVAQ